MRTLLGQLLEEQAAWRQCHPRRDGAFPGGDDRSDHLATALGVTALLNIGRPIANVIGRATEFDAAVRSGIRRLIRSGYRRRPWNETTLAALHDPHAVVWKWDTGLFFASSYWDMAHWRSRAYTVAVTLEALVSTSLSTTTTETWVPHWPTGARRGAGFLSLPAHVTRGRCPARHPQLVDVMEEFADDAALLGNRRGEKLPEPQESLRHPDAVSQQLLSFSLFSPVGRSKVVDGQKGRRQYGLRVCSAGRFPYTDRNASRMAKAHRAR